MSDLTVQSAACPNLYINPLESLADQLDPEQGRERYHKIISLFSRRRIRFDIVKVCQSKLVAYWPEPKKTDTPPLPIKDQCKDTSVPNQWSILVHVTEICDSP